MPRKTDSSNPSDWIFIADSELEGIRLLAERELSYVMCRSKLAEIVEKILKAELIRMGWFLEKTHDLRKLAGELKARNSEIAQQSQTLVNSLAEVYFISRYPGFDLDDPDWPDFRSKLALTAELLGAVKTRIEKPNLAAG